MTQEQIIETDVFAIALFEFNKEIEHWGGRELTENEAYALGIRGWEHTAELKEMAWQEYQGQQEAMRNADSEIEADRLRGNACANNNA